MSAATDPPPQRPRTCPGCGTQSTTILDGACSACPACRGETEGCRCRCCVEPPDAPAFDFDDQAAAIINYLDGEGRTMEADRLAHLLATKPHRAADYVALLNRHEGIPILDAYRTSGGRQLTVWCAHDRVWHTHGAVGPGVGDGNGHRVAHCATPTPYRDNGYILWEVDPIGDLLDELERRSPPPRGWAA